MLSDGLPDAAGTSSCRQCRVFSCVRLISPWRTELRRLEAERLLSEATMQAERAAEDREFGYRMAQKSIEREVQVCREAEGLALSAPGASA